jgi:hypothetical protein
LVEATKNLTDFKALKEPILKELRDKVDMLQEYLKLSTSGESYWNKASVEMDGYMISATSSALAYEAVD